VKLKGRGSLDEQGVKIMRTQCAVGGAKDRRGKEMRRIGKGMRDMRGDGRVL
jgi:hypothetical protein